jgi:hypothetical protein
LIGVDLEIQSFMGESKNQAKKDRLGKENISEAPNVEKK